MPDHREQLARNHHIYSHARHESEGDKGFSFWGSSNNTTSNENNEAMSLNKEAELPFLSHTTHHHSDPSRSEAIEEGRRELMEMVRDMAHHESSFELSFQDMVVHEKHVQNETSLDNTHMHNNSGERNSDKAQLKAKNNNNNNNKNKSKSKSKSKSNNNNRPGQVLRVESMDSETFLLKMFFPISLKKVKVEKDSSKVSPKPSSLQESLKQVGKEWRIRKYFQTEDINRGNTEDDMCHSSSSNSNAKSRNFDRKFSFSSPGCWPFLHRTENKANKLAE